MLYFPMLVMGNIDRVDQQDESFDDRFRCLGGPESTWWNTAITTVSVGNLIATLIVLITCIVLLVLISKLAKKRAQSQAQSVAMQQTRAMSL